MKKTIIALMMCLAMFTYAEISAGGYGGIAYIMEDTSAFDSLDAEVNQAGLPLMIEGLYRINQAFEIPGLGEECVIDVGVKGGYMSLLNIKYSLLGSTYEMKMYTIPIMAYSRAIVENFYVGFGMGIHAWVIDAYIDNVKQDIGMNGIDFCAVLEPGYIFPVMENLDVLGGLSIYSTGYETDEGDATSSSIALNLGVNYKF